MINEAWYLKPDSWVAAGTCALAVTTIFLARFTYLLFKATKEAREDSIKALDIARQNANAAHESVELAKESMERTLRAYVTVESAKPGRFPENLRSGPTHFDVSISNTGQTPASDVVGRLRYIIHKQHPEESDLGIEFTTELFRGVLGPGQATKMSLWISQSPDDGDVNAWRRNDGIPLLVLGEVTYQDMLSKVTRKTIFCYKYESPAMNPLGTLNPFGAMNRID
jgi:hypothetical protein